MYIKKIIINNVGDDKKGGVMIAHEEIEPGQVTVFEGSNGSGKSLRIKTVRSLLTKGKDFQGLLAGDAAMGDISLVAADVSITRNLTQVSSPLTVKAKGFKPVSGPDANKYVSDLFDAVSVNAESFLIEDPKARLKLILEAMPFEVDWTSVKEMFPDFDDRDDVHPLTLIESLRKKIFDERTDINRSQKEKEKASAELYKSQPPEIDLTECDRIISEAESQVRSAETRKAEQLELVRGECDGDINSARSTKDLKIKAKATEIEKKITALRVEQRAFEDKENGDFGSYGDARRKERDEVESGILAVYDDAVREASSELISWRGQRDTELKAKNVRELAGKYHMQSEEFKQDSIALTDKINSLDEFRDNMVQALPIPGVSIIDGEVFLDSKPWDKVPDSRRCTFAIDLAIQRSEESGVLIIDALEKIDDANFELVLKHLQACGRQCFVARASAFPFRIRTLEAIETKKKKAKK